MSGRVVVLFLGIALAACSTPPTAPPFEMPITVESAQFPDIDIECRGETGLSASACLIWAEQMLPAAPTKPSGGDDVPVTRLVLMYQTGNSRCAADYFAADGRLVMTAAAHCPRPEESGDVGGSSA